MGEFLHALAHHAFLLHALLAGLLASVACGVVGTYVVVRRISYVAGGIAHCLLAGLGAARYLRVVHGWAWLDPLLGATVAALLAAGLIAVVSLRARQREDTVIGAVWAVGMAVGVLFIHLTPGYNEDLLGYLFGNVLMVARRDLWLMGGLDLVLLVFVGLLFNQLQAVCFDEEQARVRGVAVEGLYLLLLVMTALTVVLLVSVVGLVMVIALLTLPAATAGHLTRTMAGMMVAATLLSAGLTTAGLALSYAPNLPAGATTIALAGLVYFLTVGGSRLVQVVRRRAGLNRGRATRP